MTKLKRVFLLEDNDANAMVFESFLEFAGCMAMDRAESLEAAEFYTDGIAEGLYDLVVLDIMLADGESTGLARRLSHTAACPIAAYTAKTTAQDMFFYQNIGFDYVFSKPLSMEHFQSGLEKLDLV